MADTTEQASEKSTSEVIPILYMSSAAAAVEWYAKLGFKQNWVHRFHPDFPAFVEISNGTMKLFLSEHTGDARPDTLLFLRVPNIDEFVAKLDGVVPEDNLDLQLRECEVKDPDGNRLRIASTMGGESKGYTST